MDKEIMPMLKSRLYWKVLGNFGFLLILITAMTILTLNILNELQRNFTLTFNDIRLLNNLERLRHYLSDVPTAANDYVLTGHETFQNAYGNGLIEFEVAVEVLERDTTDKNVVASIQQIKDLFREWKNRIGDVKIELGSQARSGKKIEAELRAAETIESQEQYMPRARKLVSDMSKRKILAQTKEIEVASDLTKQLSLFIVMINILLAVFAISLGFVLTRSITKPVRLLTEGTQKIMAGKFESINLNRSDELGLLAADFNKMSTMLGNNYVRLHAYSELVTSLNTYATEESVETTSLELLCHNTDASVGALYVVNGNENVLKLTAGYGLRNHSNRVQEFVIGEGIPGQCALEKKILEINDVPVPSGFEVETGLVTVSPRFIIAVPILFQERALGVLVLGSMKPFDELKKEILNNSVPQIGVAITNARNYEAAQKLSREIALKNEELNSKNWELEKAYRVKSDFLSGMSHELRTPLNSIIGFTSILLNPNSEPLSGDQQMALEKVLRNGKHLLQLINDILDFSRIEAGRMSINIDTDSVENTVNGAAVTVDAMVKSKNLTLSQHIVHDLPIMNTDVLKVKQILVNLLSNAVKFTDQGEISISVSQKNGLLLFVVKDTGIGIEKKNLEMVFQEFQQIDSSTTRKYQGTGLGLPISQRLARMLGGELTVESVYGKGSTFTLVVPAVFPEHLKSTSEVIQPIKKAVPPPQPQVVEAVPAQGTQILCIDDDPDVLEILRKYLVPEGYSVTTATTGDAGVALAAKIKPSLITLDIMMPQKDGWQVLRELKQHPATKNIPVIIHSMIDNKPLALSLGAIDVMPKPVEPQHLLARVQDVIRSKEEYVLIVDDSEDFCAALKKLLEDDGYNTKIAYHGKEALDIIKESTPALILLDLIMPVMDGFQFVQVLQGNERWKAIPVIILSAKDLSKQEREHLNRHIAEYMHKSDFSHEAISKIVNRILKNNQS